MKEWRAKPPLSDRSAQVRKASESYAARRQSEGWERVAVWVPASRVNDLRAFVKSLGSATGPGWAEAAKAIGLSELTGEEREWLDSPLDTPPDAS